MKRSLLPFALAATLLAACGGNGEDAGTSGPSSAQAEAAVRGYLGSLYSEDPAGACAHLSDAAQAQLVELMAFPDGPPAPNCEAATELAQGVGALNIAASGVMDYDLVPARPADEEIEVVTSKANSAELRVADSKKTVTVNASGGDWEIESMDFSDTPD